MNINNNGLDTDGYIINQASPKLISEDYKKVLDFIIELISKSKVIFSIDSIYLYGSIAKGKAVKYQSDLDLIIITNTENIETKIIEDIKQITLNKFDYITKIDMPVCSLNKINDSEKIYDIAFRIKNSGICIYGNDISDSINKFKPNKDLAFAFNKEIVQLIDKYKNYFNRNIDDELTLLLSKQISKKIIRSLFGTIIEDKKIWTDNLNDMTKSYLYFYPDYKLEINDLNKIAKEGTLDKTEMLDSINKFEKQIKDFYFLS